MKTLKFYYYDTNTHETMNITDTQYVRLERLAKTWNMTIQDGIRIMITNRLKANEFGI